MRMVQNRINNEDHDRSMANMFSNFNFKKKNDKIDWRKIASLDIDRVSRELDFHALQENIEHLTYCNIENEIDTRQLDPNFVKLFRLSQLIIEYLLHSQGYLTDVIGNLESQLERSLVEMNDMTKRKEKSEKDYHEVKKELKKTKKLMMKQQILMNPTSSNYHPCSYCSKVFMNLTYLQAHVTRRHSGAPSLNTHQQTAFNEEIDKLKEKLRQTENELGQARLLNSKDDVLIRKMEEWKSEQQRRQTEEIAQLKENFSHEIQAKVSSYERALSELNKQQSNVGNYLKDDVEWDKEQLGQKQEQIDELKGQLKMNNEKFMDSINELNQEWNAKYKKLQNKLKREMANAVVPRATPTPPPPVVPRHTRSPSPVKNMEKHRQPQSQSQQVDLYLSDYCPLTCEEVKYDANILKTAKEAVKKFLDTQLDELGIHVNDRGLAQGDFKMKQQELKNYRDETAQDLPHFTQMRKEFNDLCGEYCKQRLSNSLKPTGSKVKFEKNLISTGKRSNKSQIAESALIKSALSQHRVSDDDEDEEENELSDEVSISNAQESNDDDDTEPTNVLHHHTNATVDAIVSSALKKPINELKLPPKELPRADDLDDISDLEEVPGDRLQPNGKISGFVQQTASKLDKKLQNIQKQGPKASKSMVPMGFQPSKKQELNNDDDSVSISSFELDNKQKPKQKLSHQQSLDTSTNTSIWASVTHTNQQQQQNGTQNGDRPATANSALTFNLDSDEFDLN